MAISFVEPDRDNGASHQVAAILSNASSDKCATRAAALYNAKIVTKTEQYAAVRSFLNSHNLSFELITTQSGFWGAQRLTAHWYRAVLLISTALLLFCALPFLLAATSDSTFYGLKIDQPAPVITDPELGRIDVPAGGLGVVFFGYQYCGTVCPVQLVNLQKLHDSLPDAPIRFVFVTLDPERDTRQALNLAMTNFGENFVSVRPRNNRAAQALARSYGDFTAKQGAGTGYEFNHSAHLYVVTASGQRELVYTTPALDLERVRRDLSLLLSKQERVQSNG